MPTNDSSNDINLNDSGANDKSVNDPNVNDLSHKKPQWQKQKDILKKIQLNFSLLANIDKGIRQEAVNASKSPSTIVREILGLETKIPQRPRLSVSFSHDELTELYQRFGLLEGDRAALTRHITEQLKMHYQEYNRKK